MEQFILARALPYCVYGEPDIFGFKNTRIPFSALLNFPAKHGDSDISV
jgi:hypothetical protein